MFRRIRESLKCQKGFTLVELMVVIAIIGILAAIAIPKFTDATKNAQVAKIQGDLSTIDSAIAMYYASEAAWPTALSDLTNKGQLSVEPKAPVGNYAIDGSSHRATWNGLTADDDKDTIKNQLP